MTYNPYDNKFMPDNGSNNDQENATRFSEPTVPPVAPQHEQPIGYTEQTAPPVVPQHEQTVDYTEQTAPPVVPQHEQAVGYTEPNVAPPTHTPELDYTVDEYYKEHFADENYAADSYARYGESYYNEEPVQQAPAYEPQPVSTNHEYANIYSSSPYTSSSQTRKKKVKKEKKPVSRSALVIVLLVSILSSMLLGVGGGYFAANVLSKNSASGSALTVSQSDSNSSSYASSTANLTTTQIVDKTADAVVEITTESVVTGSFSQQYIQSGAGSGVIVSKDGYIVTNYHVIEGASNITVTLRDQTEYTDVKVVGTYAAGDIALLKITPKKTLAAATLGNSEKIAVGDYAVVIGNPLGQLGGSVTDGIISALDREVTIDDETYNLLQTNAEISPGNSGGGLFNGNGELIGIVNAKSSSNSAEGIGFAIPVNDVVDIISDLKQYGYVKGQIDLGMSLTDVSSTAQLWMFGANQTGVYVTSVNAGSNAAKAGFKVGDVITGINSTEIKSKTELKASLKKLSVGDKVKFTVYRSGQKGTIEMQLEESKADANTSSKESSSNESSDDWANNPWSIFN
ncbi:MAG: trypsin-like peptidase domain-containing protein [Ruminococcus sp.]|nr:trypsin-like peptidase domain-containing protein [Ruminococcus sp.]